jgi:predicted nucleic acid-binding protein
MMFVVDNSVVMRWLFNDGSEADKAYADQVAQLTESGDVHVPNLFNSEAANVIARALKKGEISRQESAECFELIAAMNANVAHDSDTLVISDIALLAFDTGLSAYDATYLRLAKRLNCALATLDADLRKAAAQCGVQVVLFPSH